MTQFIIFDTEFTAWQGSKERNWSESWEHREVIQLAAIKVLVEPHSLRIASSFNALVKPVINPVLSLYITELTGIEQQVLDEMGVDFPDALNQLHMFAEQGALPCYCWGTDNLVLSDNCDLNQMKMPEFHQGFYNLNAILRKENIRGTHLCSGELVDYLGLKLTGHVHNALYDVRSIAMALNYWISNNQLSTTMFCR